MNGKTFLYVYWLREKIFCFQNLNYSDHIQQFHALITSYWDLMYLRRLMWNVFLFQMQYSFTAVDRVVQRSLPKLFVNLYGDTAYLELTNAYGLFRRCVLRLHLSLLGIQRSHPACVADAKREWKGE